jgi:ABC-2 type transport system permease protein
LRLLRQDLITIEKALNNDTLDEQALHIIATRDRISTIEAEVTTWTTVPPEVIISPLQHSHENLQGDSLNFMSYYAPGVFALILQHIAIMLGALSLVRERETGAFEHYRVTPVSMLQILIGKYLSYIILIGSIAVVLLLLITGVLGVPFLGRVADAAGLIALFLLATLGIGFFISAIARSDNQAVQFSMLALLLSIFFSGLLLPLEYFSQTFRIVSYLLPLTHCIIGLQDLMLRGTAPGYFTWGSLISMSAATLGIVMMLAQRQFRRVV